MLLLLYKNCNDREGKICRKTVGNERQTEARKCALEIDNPVMILIEALSKVIRSLMQGTNPTWGPVSHKHQNPLRLAADLSNYYQ
jgi:hypothetical protein